MNARSKAVLAGTERYSVEQADSLAYLRACPPGTFDLVFGSPPYENRRTYGELDFDLQGEVWVRWILDYYTAALRACRGLVCMVMQGPTEGFHWSATPCLVIADLKRGGCHVRAPAIFYRNGIAGGGGPDYLRNDYEFVVVAQAGDKSEGLPWSDNTAFGHLPKYGPGGAFSHRQSDGKRVNQWGGCGGQKTGQRRKNGERQNSHRPGHEVRRNRERDGSHREQNYKPPVLSNPGNVTKLQATYTAEEVALLLQYHFDQLGDVLHIPVGGNLMGHKLAHLNEAPYPIDLPLFFARTFCPPDGLVFDPFCGSGTTAHACVLSGRRCITVDLRASQVQLANRRLAGVTPLLFEEKAPICARPQNGATRPEFVRDTQGLLFGDIDDEATGEGDSDGPAAPETTEAPGEEAGLRPGPAPAAGAVPDAPRQGRKRKRKNPAAD